MPRRGTVQVLIDRRTAEDVAAWLLTRRKPEPAALGLTLDEIDKQHRRLLALQAQLARAGRSKRGKRYISIARDEASAFVGLTRPHWPAWSFNQPAAVRTFFRQLDKILHQGRGRPHLRHKHLLRTLEKAHLDQRQRERLAQRKRREDEVEAWIADMQSRGESALTYTGSIKNS